MAYCSQNWRYSLFYFLYFLSLGALVPYWSVYLNSLDFSAVEIGELIATLAATKIFSPYLWGWLADKTGHHVLLVKWSSLFSCCLFLPLLWVGSYWGIMILMVLFSFFWNATLPQFEVVTLAYLGNDHQRYGHIRLWGSIGFIASVFILALLIPLLSIALIPIAVLVILLSIAVSASTFETVKESCHDSGHIIHVIKRPEVIALLLGCFFMQLSHGPYYTFFTLYMDEQGYSIETVSAYWALGVIAEVILFLFVFRLFQLKDATFYLLLSLLLTSFRWFLTAAFSEHAVVMFFAQTLHAASFGLFHASAIYLVNQYFSQHKGRGQALYASVSFGAGGALGSLYSGYLWDYSSPNMLFYVAALIALMGAIVYYVMLYKLSKKTRGAFSKQL